MLGFCASFRAGRVSEARICIKLLIAYLAFVNEFIPDWQVMTDTIIKTDNITGKFANFSVFFFPYLAVVSGYSDVPIFTLCLENGHESVTL